MKRGVLWLSLVLVAGCAFFAVFPKVFANSVNSGVVKHSSHPGPVALAKTTVISGNVVRPNELGRVMILEYHLIGYPENEWRRTPENFRNDLKLLYDNGYYPVPLEDYVHGTMRVPAGKTPFVLTFDDSSAGQFRFLNEGNHLNIDSESAVGIMERFKKDHPDFPLTATFYVLPEIPKGLRLFGQEEYIKEKLNWLVEHGYEIGNHSYWHQNLGKTDDLGVQKQLALAVKEIQSYVPGYPVRSLALPLGVHPKTRDLEHDGAYQGFRYHHDSVLLVGSGPALSPYAANFNPYKLERIQAGDTAWGPAAYMALFNKQPSLRYISDGDPATIAIPKELQPKLDKNAISRFKVNGVTIIPDGA